MDSPQKKLGSMPTMDGETPHLLPVTTVSETAPKETLAAPPDAVLVVGSWALLPAFMVIVFYALHYAVTFILLLFILLTGAEADAAEVSALDIGTLCCAALQAAAAVLALRPTCRRVWVRYAFAYLALALTIVGQCMLAAQARLLIVADPGDHFFRITCTVSIFIYTLWAISSVSWPSSFSVMSRTEKVDMKYVAD